jgi:hypothetical protein
MDSDEVQIAFKEIEADIQREWEGALTRRKREEKWRELRTTKKLQSKLTAYAGQAPQ